VRDPCLPSTGDWRVHPNCNEKEAVVSRTGTKSKKTPIFVEFVGLPGSGKTTLSHRAAEILREKGTTVLEPTYLINNQMGTTQRYLTKSWYLTKLAFLRPVWALDWFLLVVQSRQRTLKDFVLMVVNCFFILEIYRQHGRRIDICFLDQGICQALLSLSYSAQTEQLIERKLITDIAFFLTPRFRVVHIEADEGTIAQRLEKRYKKRSRLETLKETTDFMEIVRGEKRTIENLLEILRSQLQADIHTLQQNGSEDIYFSAQQIVKMFTDRCS